jgi:hypothetical protein
MQTVSVKEWVWEGEDSQVGQIRDDVTTRREIRGSERCFQDIPLFFMIRFPFISP